ncbi:4Fe-4S ferredoxin iron-sulfur binding domain protein [Staphylothermus hellenicus DSM 12710]|uniref:4Fe-4S ferredoxin iron-sulfur binding domain protein n=2 Tax=Staphylothermus hellenicus TaxID=84599 RepID=D7D979_STAHD|nr:4Fe-4S ferredoxin iron-sulfur binding domain protein [Staphylothermus hellenicus DSM 12710]
MGKEQSVKKDILGREIKDLSKKDWWGIPRKEIDWYPRIDYERCIGCGLCLFTCGRTVYDWDFEKMRPVVARPYNCMVGCDTCAKACPRDAIWFPPLGYLRKMRDKALAITKSRKTLEKIKQRIKNEKSL